MTELPHAHGDFETKSACDLKTRGSYVYAADPTGRTAASEPRVRVGTSCRMTVQNRPLRVVYR